MTNTCANKVTYDEFEEFVELVFNQIESMDKSSSTYYVYNEIRKSFENNRVFNEVQDNYRSFYYYVYKYISNYSTLRDKKEFILNMYRIIFEKEKIYLDATLEVIEKGDIVITGFFIMHKVLGFTKSGSIKTSQLVTNKVSYKEPTGVVVYKKYYELE